jgi:hypothetical protein
MTAMAAIFPGVLALACRLLPVGFCLWLLAFGFWEISVISVYLW